MAKRKCKRKNNRKSSTGIIYKPMKFYGAEELNLLPRDERIEVPIKNGHLVQDEIVEEVSSKEEAEKLHVRKPKRLISKSNKVKNMQIKNIDFILSSELLINSTPTEYNKNTNPATGNNNNDTDLSDQNNSASSSITPSEIKCEKTKDANTPRINNVMIEITLTPTVNNLAPVSSPEVSQNDAINKAKKPAGKGKFKETYRSKLFKKKRDIIALEILGVQPPVAPSPKFQCDHCQTTFCSKASIQRHMLMHLNLKPYTCSHCPDKSFRQQCNLRVHIAKMHPKEFEKLRNFCRICKKPFRLLEHLKLHQKAHSKEKQKRYHCAFCDKVFKTKLLMVQHEKLHMVPGRYKCSMCPMSYDSRQIYSNHLKTHALLKNYSCQYCGKAYLRPSSIARHIRVGHGGMRMQCPICKKLLRGHLTEHMRTHENERPHTCDICGQKFTQSTQLTVHKRSHSGARPYPCKICKQAFSHSNALMLHIRRHTGEKPFECALCPQTFSQLPHMKAHMRSIHRKTEFYKCDNCNTFFKLKALLEAHAEECGGANGKKKQEKAAKTKDNSKNRVSRMRFLLALLFTMIASKEKLYDLGFNKRLIDDILVDSVEAMGLAPCRDPTVDHLSRLRINVLMLLRGTVPKRQMALFAKEKKTTEELLELLTDVNEKK